MQWVATVRLLWIHSIRFHSFQTVNKLIKHWRRHSNVLKRIWSLTLHCWPSVIVILREDYNTFCYWVKDDNSRHQREKIAPIFHKCQFQRKFSNNSEKIFVDNREPQCKYRKLPLISPSPPPPPTPVIWPSACKEKNTSIISPLQMCGTEFDLLWGFEP